MWSRQLVGLRQRKVSRGLSKLDKLSFSWQRAEGYARFRCEARCMFFESFVRLASKILARFPNASRLWYGKLEHFHHYHKINVKNSKPLQAAPRCKQAGKRRTLRPPVLKKSNPVSQGEDDVLKMSDPPRWRHRVRLFRRATRVRAGGLEISVRPGGQPKISKISELKNLFPRKTSKSKN